MTINLKALELAGGGDQAEDTQVQAVTGMTAAQIDEHNALLAKYRADNGPEPKVSASSQSADIGINDPDRVSGRPSWAWLNDRQHGRIALEGYDPLEGDAPSDAQP